MNTLQEVRENLAISVAEGMKKNNILWHDQNLPPTLPRSLVSGREFGGVNALYLMKSAAANGYEDPRWVTVPKQDNVEQDKKIVMKSEHEAGTALEYWVKGNNGLQVNTPTYYNVQQLNSKSVEHLTPEESPPRAEREAPHYVLADAVLKNLDVAIPKEKSQKAYQEALGIVVNNISKDAPELENVSTENLKKLRTDMAHSFLSLSLGMGVPEADNSLPVSSWVNSISHDPRQLVYAARDANKLSTNALTKGQELLESKEEVKELSPNANDLKVGDKILCKRKDREFVGEVKFAENGKVIVASVSKSGNSKEYENLHERGWKYEPIALEKEQEKIQSESTKDVFDFSKLKVEQEVMIIPKIPKENGKTDKPFLGTIIAINSEKQSFEIVTVAGHKYSFGSETLAKKYGVEEIPYEQTLKCAHDRVEALKEQKVIASEAKTAELSRYENFKNNNARLLEETGRYAIINIGKETKTPLIASVVSIGQDNMNKLRATKDNNSTVLLEKTNGKIAIKTPEEIAQEKEKSQTRTQSMER
jgi:hypothetical protein